MLRVATTFHGRPSLRAPPVHCAPALCRIPAAAPRSDRGSTRPVRRDRFKDVSVGRTSLGNARQSSRVRARLPTPRGAASTFDLMLAWSSAASTLDHPPLTRRSHLPLPGHSTDFGPPNDDLVQADSTTTRRACGHRTAALQTALSVQERLCELPLRVPCQHHMLGLLRSLDHATDFGAPNDDLARADSTVAVRATPRAFCGPTSALHMFLTGHSRCNRRIGVFAAHMRSVVVLQRCAAFRCNAKQPESHIAHRARGLSGSDMDSVPAGVQSPTLDHVPARARSLHHNPPVTAQTAARPPFPHHPFEYDQEEEYPLHQVLDQPIHFGRPQHAPFVSPTPSAAAAPTSEPAPCAQYTSLVGQAIY
ncbi:hypothetical protein FS749_016676 [Ceratobasidium sp. UAMH 11750]|nr:hypothetical protein FS749_016676 [Ceratobasidium sp. UAMH 11750]